MTVGELPSWVLLALGFLGALNTLFLLWIWEMQLENLRKRGRGT